MDPGISRIKEPLVLTGGRVRGEVCFRVGIPIPLMATLRPDHLCWLTVLHFAL